MGNTLNAFGKPVFAQTPTQTVADLQAAADFTDTFANARRGTEAERSALTTAQRRSGMLFSTTDSKTTYRWDAPGVWTVVHIQDTGWTTLTLSTGWAVYAGETPMYRVKNGYVSMIGRVSVTGAGSGTLIATLPSNARLTGTPQLVTIAHSDHGPQIVTAKTNGQIDCISNTGTTNRGGISLSSIVYPVGF